MANKPRKNNKRQRRKVQAASILPMTLPAGFFLGVGLGALMNNMLLVTLLGVIIGGGFGYYVDKRNGIPYTRGKR